MATLMDALFDLGRLRLDPSLPRDLSQLAQRDAPIRELFS